MPKKNRDHSSRHHTRPSSRGGTGPHEDLMVFSGDERKKRPKKHPSWHTLFSNLTLPEVLTLLALWERPDGTLNVDFLSENMRAAWHELFGSASTPREAVAWIFKAFGLARIRRDCRAQFADRDLDDVLAAIRRNFAVV